MRMFSVLVNSGADPTLEDHRGHNAQYYMDHQEEIVIPEWTNRYLPVTINLDLDNYTLLESTHYLLALRGGERG